MNKFESEIKVGNFVTSECTYCKKIVWPPSDYCDNCFMEVNWRKVSPNGKLIEWSKKNNDIFCIAEFENTIRVMGKLDTKNVMLKSGQLLKFIKCSLNYKPKFFFTLI
jgi:uncharacterized OB-fold protein